MKLVFDTETTGIDKDDQIISVGSIMVIDSKTFEYETMIEHTKDISLEAMSIHHIRKVGTNAVPFFLSEAWINLNMLEPKDILIGQNIEFDLSMAEFEEERINFKVFDTMLVADYFKDLGLIDNAKTNLQYLRYYLLTEKTLDKLEADGGKAHGALFDCKVTYEIYKRLIYIAKKNNIDLEDLYSLFTDRNKPENLKFRFGKHKGKTVAEVVENHKDYAGWFYFNVEGNENIKEAILSYNQESLLANVKEGK